MSGVPVTARACANIALVKYWGKRDVELNLPATGSLSLTLDALVTETTVRFDPTLASDVLVLDGKFADASRVTPFLDLVRTMAQIETRAHVVSANEFPTASGLASSASGFAALALAATKAASLSLEPRELSRLARRGSGSAARSIFGGFARMHAGTAADGSDAFATPVPSPLLDNVRMVIAIVERGKPKKHGSSDAMEHCAATSPLYPGWLSCVPGDLEAAEAALALGDLRKLGEVTEDNALAKHAAAIASRPAIIYWHPATVMLLLLVHKLQEEGIGAWPTMDAGPHVKVLTSVDDVRIVERALSQVPGVTQTMVSTAGGPAEVIE
jgi:diphosphomevalonate decarboxylase